MIFHTRYQGKKVYVIGLLALLIFGATRAPSQEKMTIRAGRLTGPIHLDGKLDEPAWHKAGVIENLQQADPHPGEPTPFHTKILIAVDSGHLYIGVICHDPEPSKIALHTMQRDGNVRGDQTIAFVLDTYGDERRGYYFEINSAGARIDGLISGPESISFDWDGIWDARTARFDKGWTAEIEIPAQTLHFTSRLESWGFNIQRRIARERITLRWSGISLDARLEDLQRAGKLYGIEHLEQGAGLSISPYALTRRNASFITHETSINPEIGLDVTYNLTPDLSLVFTINTDFAETEVDTRQVNLTRFPLFFPEKRAFFLEASNSFQFGLGLRRDFIPFFSRRIGLFHGQQVPLLGGVKILGRIGRWGIAALDVVTGETDHTRRTNLFASRITFDMTRHMTFGLLTTYGDPEGMHTNGLMGFDAIWRTSTFRGDKNLALGGWVVFSKNDTLEGQKTGWGFKIDYPNDLWDVFFIFKEFGDALDPALGFLPRPGTRWYQGGGAYQPRPRNHLFRWVRQFYFELYMEYIEDLQGHLETWRLFTAPFNAQTQSGEHIEGNVVFQFERLKEPFEIVEGIIIPPGKYSFRRYRIEAQSSRHRPWRIGTTLWFGEFYSGRLIQWESFFTLSTFHGHIQLEVNTENDFLSLPQGKAVQRLWQLRVTFAFTPDLILSSYIQYDSESRNLGTNTRIRWTLHPGNDIYVIWNHGWEHPIGSRDPWTLHPVDDQFVIKIRWTFRT